MNNERSTWKFFVGGVIGVLIGALSAIEIIPEGSELLSASNQGPLVIEGGGELAEPVDGAVEDEGTTDDQAAGTQRRVIRRGGDASDDAGAAQSGQAGAEGGVQTGGGAAGAAECAAGRNGGSTDVGVTGDQVKFGATVAESGIAKDFLGEARQAMEAVRKKINRGGGVCGRSVEIVYKDDGWNPETGRRFIQNLIEDEKVFALAVVPSSEGLNAASEGGDLQAAGVPVIGSDGMIRTQYTDPMIWPVAAATTTTMHVAMKNAWDRAEAEGVELKPAIVFENNFRFGVEGAYAFNQAYKRLSGQDIPGYKNPLSSNVTCENRFCGIQGGQGQYGSEVAALNDACGSDCNFLMLLLEPKTAQDWMAVSGVMEPKDLTFGMAGGQPLFTFNFGKNCGDKCHEMWLWTGYKPPIEQFRGDPDVKTYVDDLHDQKSTADEFNQFTQGAYLGMLLLEEGLKKTGPNLTRQALIQTLDSMTLDKGLSKPLSWKKGDHVANPAAQAFKIEAKNGFTGWSFAQDWVDDPWRTEDFG